MARAKRPVFALAAPLALVAASLEASAQGGGLFDSAAYVPDADHGHFRASGDFDGDGHLDLVHATGWWSWTGLTIYLGDGTGRFTRQTEVPFPAGDYDYAERDPAVGDFDGDGNLDVAIDRNSIPNLDGVVVFWGDGAGGFGGQTEVGLGNYVAALYRGEIDGDAADELLVHHDVLAFQGHYTWLNWNGSSFGQSASLPVGGTPDPDGAFVETLGDFDGDGDDDVAATGGAGYSLVRIFPTVNGDVTYGPSFPVPAPMQNINHRLKAGDLDGDGDPDLVHLKMYTGDPGPWVQTYENVGGTLVQRPHENVPTPSTGWMQPHNLRLGDWNGDGWIDLFSLNQSVDVVRSDGDWTFSEGMQLPDFAQEPSVAILDVDGDGHTDIVGARTIHWGDGTFTAPAPLKKGSPLTFPDGFQPYDIDGDGDVDLTGGANGLVLANDGVGNVTQTLSGFPPPASGFSYQNQVAYADFTGDGRRDHLVQLFSSFSGLPAFVEMRLLAAQPSGKFVDVGVAAPALVKINPPAAQPDGYWETADADGDGDLDLLEAGGWWRNSGSGYLEAFVPTFGGRLFDAADVDADGDVDLLSVDSGDVMLLRNAGDGAYAGELIGTLAGKPLARFVDLDEDGDLDVAAADPGGVALLLAEDLGAAFGAPLLLEAQVRNLRMLGVADLNGDGLSDLLTTRTGALGALSTIQIITEHHRTGSGLAYEVAHEYLPNTLFGDFDGAVDLDADGDLDLFGFETQLAVAVTPDESGTTQQFGAGLAGTGGVTPILGAKGPPTSTHTGSEIRLVRAVGGGMMWFAFGLNEVAVPDAPLPGMTLYTAGGALLGPFPLGGVPGEPGGASFALPLPKIPALAGLTVVHQMFVLDAGSPAGGTSTNGLRITYGL